MAKSKSNVPTQSELKTQVDALIIEDENISKANKSKTTKLVLNKDSFYLRLASTVSAILKLENSKVLTKELKQKYNLGKIDRRRLSEAMWLFNSYDKVVAWLKATKKRYENISSLQKAFNKAHKPKTDETKSQENETQSQDSPKSDTNEPKAQADAPKKLTVSDLALETLVQIDVNNIDMMEFLTELQKQFLENNEVVKQVEKEVA